MSAARQQPAEASRGSNRPPMSQDELTRAYGDMLLIRRFEERTGQLYGMGLIGGFCHLYIGQEAIVVGVQMALRQGDKVVTSYRDHGHMLAAGMDPKGRHGRADRTRHRLLARQGRLDAHVLQEGELLRRPRHRRRPGLDRRRPGVRQQVSRHRRGRGGLHGRRRLEPGPGVRELQPGGAADAAMRVRDREQPIRHGHQRRPLPRRRSRCRATARPGASPASRWTAWTWWRCARRRRRRWRTAAPARAPTCWR